MRCFSRRSVGSTTCELSVLHSLPTRLLLTLPVTGDDDDGDYPVVINFYPLGSCDCLVSFSNKIMFFFLFKHDRINAVPTGNTFSANSRNKYGNSKTGVHAIEINMGSIYLTISTAS